MQEKQKYAKPVLIGGQAVIEGVMMRGPGAVATAVRRADGEIVVKSEAFVSRAERNHLFGVPVIRGAVTLIEMVVLGIRMLNFSAEVALQGQAQTVKDNGNSRKRRSESYALGATLAISLVAAIGVFLLLPLVMTTSLFDVQQNPLEFNLIAGGIRMGIFLVYLLAISALKDIRRVFEYHGAEHKVVSAFERGFGLDVPASMRQPRFHPRCGTSFLLTVLVIAIAIFSVADALLILWLGEIHLVTRSVVHLLILPVIAGVGYEFIRMSAKRSNTFLGVIATAPGLWLQRITTREPDEHQVEVAVAALRSALGEDRTLAAPAGVPSLSEVSLN